MIEIHGLPTIGEVVPGDDLAALLCTALEEAGVQLAAGDILVVTSKIISKAEGRFVDLGDITPGEEAQRLAALTRKDARLVELVLAQSSEVVRAAPHVLITRHKSGWVMASGGPCLAAPH